MSKIRKTAAIATSIALVGGAGIGAAQAATASKSTTASQTRTDRPGPGGPRGGAMSAAQLKTIAGKLGITSAQLKSALDATRPARPTTPPAAGEKPPRPDHTALVKALADALSKSQADVQAAFDKVEAAHRAEHEERHTAMFTALAEKLGLEAADVKAAFEAARPARRTP